MAIFNSDRQKRIIGDRIIAKQQAFNQINPGVKDVFSYFEKTHVVLQEALEERQREETEDSMARQKREEAVDRAMNVYSWAYNQVQALLQPSWNEVTDPTEVDSVRERLFPLGNPTAVSASTQLTIDGLTHFLNAVEREDAVRYPANFISDAKKVLDSVSKTVDEVSREMEETRNLTKAAIDMRNDWENAYLSLKEITSCYLRLNNEHHRMGALFGVLPSASKGAAEGEDAAVTDPVTE